jgi:hypothetical protein
MQVAPIENEGGRNDNVANSVVDNIRASLRNHVERRRLSFLPSNANSTENPIVNLTPKDGEALGIAILDFTRGVKKLPNESEDEYMKRCATLSTNEIMLLKSFSREVPIIPSLIEGIIDRRVFKD